MIRPLSVIALGLFLATSAVAQDDDPILAACLEEAFSTVDITDCFAEAHARWDAELNDAYGAAMAGLSKGRQEALREAQRLWIDFRDANCLFYGHPDGGTMVAIEVADCLTRLTRDRARELREIRLY